MSGVTVTAVPGRFRPGVGRIPRREPRRPMLPQHSRMCGPLEAASALGFVVYPALQDHESFHIRRTSPGELQFAFFGGDAKRPSHQFTLHFVMPGNGIGVWSEDLLYRAPDCPWSAQEIAKLRDALLRMASLWVPAGAVALRGAYDFSTPEGWDTVFTGLLNQGQAPVVQALTGRVETDWYAFETEFRYVLQVGESLSGSGKVPVGQAFVVPRTEVALEVASAADEEAFRRAQDAFQELKDRRHTDTALGFGYDVVYKETSRRRSEGEDRAEGR